MIALICGKLALGSAMPLPLLMPLTSHCASQHESMPDMSMPGMSMPPAPARSAPCCRSGACALLQAPALALMIPALTLRLQIAAQPPPLRLEAAAVPISAPFRPPI